MALSYEIFGDRCLLEKHEVEVEEKTEGGIYLPQEAVEKEMRKKHIVLGTIKMVGPEVSAVKGDDVILYHISDTIPIWLEGKEYSIIKEEKIIGKKK